MAAKKNVEDKYKKYELLEHILALPDTYIGSTEPVKVNTYIFNESTQKMEDKAVTYIPGLLKIFDEVIVNAIDHSMRLKSEELAGREDMKHVKNIKININKETGYISVYNDGNGVDIKKHSTYGDLWIPELIFGELLTSTNYDKNEEKIWGGKNGYGSKLTNIFSNEFTIETVDHYTKKIFTQTFKNNMTERSTAVVKACSKNPYTIITFLPDYKRFGMKNITEDIYKLFQRRVIDACASTPKDVSVYFNDEKLSIKDFEKYCNLYLEQSNSYVYEKCGERWEVAVAISKSGSFEQISFVNGINTIRGGKHIEYISNMITKNLVEMAAAKKKKTIKSQHIKDNIFIFVKALIVNPSFDSQSKETLTTPVAKFGSKCDLSDKFYDKLFKLGIIEKAISLTEFHDQKKLVKTDGKKVSKIIVPKLDDANLAGTKNSSECTLILTEGDSAKTMAIAGLSVVGRDRYGVFPLRGKVLNVKDATLQKISDNNEITAIKKILGLEQNKKYTNLSQLRYGSIMIMTDQDHDGSHIKGLIFNVFQSMWSELYKIDGFMTSMLTPIIKATNTKGDMVEFYNITDYDRWSLTDIAKKSSWKIKYYKGLGTSSDQEAKEYFKKMKKITYNYDEYADEAIDLAFNKKRADDRKNWLSSYNKDDVLDYTDLNVSYKTFVDKDLIHFSNRDLQRSINHICDGLKESTRKILFACFKRKLFTNEIKVAQLSGYVSEVSAYHHGETSLQQAIVGMAQIFVGTNNINLLMPNGQHGCLDPDTDIIMWNGKIKKAKDVLVGDQLIGDDGNVRNVLDTIQGEDDMYEICMRNGETYKVNSQHILTLKYHDLPDTYDIKVDDFLKISEKEQSKFYCIKNSECINWKNKEVPIDPYIMGAWLSDEILNNTEITSISEEILKENNLFNNKHIPEDYIINDKNTRLQLLAGFVDTNGCVKTSKDGNPIIEITQCKDLSHHIIESLMIVAKSLGFNTSIGYSNNQSVLSIYGDNLDEIPTRVHRKKIAYATEKSKSLYSYSFTIKKLGKGKYNGWSIDGNKRFLLGDFTITHNSRCQGGQDASSPRYIFTLLSKLTKLLFKEEDSFILNYQEDDGQLIEPEYYIPVIPTILVNGGVGIGTGYSTNIPQFNPSDLINICRTICEVIKIADINVKSVEDLDAIYDTIDVIDIKELTPYYLGFKGTIENTEKNTYMSKGVYRWIDDETLEITELPVGIWTEDYKDMLENMITNNQNNLKYIENHYTSKNVRFILHFSTNAKNQTKDNFESTFKLSSTKNMSINNMHLFNEEGAIKKYNGTTEIIKEWAEVRIRKYFERKTHQISILEKDYNLMSAKVKFILDVISGNIQIMNKKLVDIASRLTELKYPKIFNKTEENDDDEDTAENIKGYLYLLKLPISQLTHDRKITLEKQMEELLTKLHNLKNTKIEDLWLFDLKELETEWNKHKEYIELDYENDRKGIVNIETKKKKK